MYKPKRKLDMRDLTFCIAFSGIGIIITGLMILEKTGKIGLYSKRTCTATNYSYPESIEDVDKFVNCNCGKRCTTSTACGKIIRPFHR